MYRLIIVDDEKLIRESLCRTINWEKLGFQVVASCRDGVEAYNAVLDEYPDVVLSDIKMPGLSGLDLAREAKTLDPSIEFVLLSGYGEFEFAQQAIQFGVRDYLLKPIDEEVLVKTFQKIRENLLQRDRAHRDRRNIETRLRDQLLIESLAFRLSEPSQVQRCEALGVPPECRLYLLDVRGVGEELAQALCAGCKNTMTDRQSVMLFSPVYADESVVFACALAGEEEANLICRELERLMGVEHRPSSVFCRRYGDLKDLLQALVCRLKETRKTLLLDPGGTCHELLREGSSAAIPSVFTSDSGWNAERITEICRYLQETANPETARALAAKVMVPVLDTRYEELGHFVDRLYGCDTKREIADLVQEELEKHTLNVKAAPSLSRRIIDYVSENLQNQDLSLKWLAENVLFMNVNYVSKRFQKETGENFSVFITRLRVNRARQLLAANHQYHVYDVAQMVGFGNNPRYFSQIFKKYTGKTPSGFLEHPKEYQEKETEKR